MGWEKKCPEFQLKHNHNETFKIREQIGHLLHEEFWNSKYCKQLNDVAMDAKRNVEGATFSIDDTFDLASRVQMQLDGKAIKVFDQVQSVMYKGRTLVSLRFTAGGAEAERKDVGEWLQEHILKRPKPSSTNKNLGQITIFTDDCCKHRNFYEGIFGKGVRVKLDRMHAFSRILKLLKPRTFQGNTRELFDIRDKIRYCGLPPEGKIRGGSSGSVGKEDFLIELNNLKKIIPSKMLTSNVKKAIENLTLHYECLADHSEIASERGTNSNERVHRKCRGILPKTMTPVNATPLVRRFIARENSATDNFPGNVY